MSLTALEIRGSFVFRYFYGKQKVHNSIVLEMPEKRAVG